MFDYDKLFSTENEFSETLIGIEDELGKKTCSEDIKLCSDYHLFREYRKKFIDAGFCPGAFPINRTENIIKMHNKYVKKSDIFVFFGDCVDDQLYNDTKNDYKNAPDLLKRSEDIFKNQLNGRIKIIILGNNDLGSEDLYIKNYGFDYVIHGPVTFGNHILSHEPVEVPKGKINIHGHIHFKKTYFDIDWRRHIDVCIDNLGHPMIMKDVYKLYAKGFFNGETIKTK